MSFRCVFVCVRARVCAYVVEIQLKDLEPMKFISLSLLECNVVSLWYDISVDKGIWSRCPSTCFYNPFVPCCSRPSNILHFL